MALKLKTPVRPFKSSIKKTKHMYTTKYRNCATPAGRMNYFFNDPATREFFATGSRTGSTVPASNVKETKENFVIELAAPGMEKSDFSINLENDTLTISAERKTEAKAEGERYTRKEFSYSTFSRAFSLPETVKTDEIAATYEKGVLSITLPKKPEAEKNSSKQITVA